MQPTRRALLLTATAAFAAAAFAGTAAADWRKQYPEVTLGVITSENEADRVVRYRPVMEYFEKKLGVRINWRSATDYAGIIEGVKAKKVEIARFGPAAYAQAWIVTEGQVEPLVGELDPAGDFGYYSVVVVKNDSPFKTMDDLKGKTFAFADPNSTSGFQAPSYFMREAGIDPTTFFGSTTFSGSHENSIMALVNGSVDAAATWARTSIGNVSRMEGKGMIPAGSTRTVWTSPLLPASPWAMPTWLPEEMRRDVTKVLLDMPTEGKDAWLALTDGKAAGFKQTTHEEYDPIVRMIRENLRQRRSS